MRGGEEEGDGNDVGETTNIVEKGSTQGENLCYYNCKILHIPIKSSQQ